MTEDRGFVIENLEIVGDAVQVQAAGRGRLESGAPIELSLELQSDLAALLPDLTSGGRMDVDGSLTFTPTPAAILAGDLRVEGQDLPAELLAPLLAVAELEGLQLEGTQIDLDADIKTRIEFDQLATDPGSDLVRGRADLTWRREERPLIVASVLTPDVSEVRPETEVLVDVDLQILPEAEGIRSLSGQVLVPQWNELKNLEFENLELEIRQDDLASLAEELGVTAESFGGLRPIGSLLITATASGPAMAPKVELEGSWHLEDERIAELSARSSSRSNLEFHGELLPESPGALQVDGVWLFAGLESIRQGSFENLKLQIDLPDVEQSLARLEGLLEVLIPDPASRPDLLAALSPEIRDRLTGGLRADLSATGPLDAPVAELAANWEPTERESVSLEASYEEGLLVLKELSGDLLGVLPNEEVVQFAARGQGVVETPIRDVTLALQVFNLNDEIRRLDLNAQLTGGTLTLEGSAHSLPGEIQATIPLAALKALLADVWILDEYPLLFDSGPLEVEISELGLGRTSEVALYLAGSEVPDLEIQGVLDALVSLDSTNLMAAVGTVDIKRLKVRYRDNDLRSDSKVRIDLADGEISLVPAQLRFSGPRTEAPLDLKLTAELDQEWQLESGFLSLIREIDLDLRGTVDSSALTPFLAGGVATGPVAISAQARGSIENLQAEVSLTGPEASLVLPGTYRTRISAPEIEVFYGPAGLELRDSRMRLNRGEVTLSGSQGEDQSLTLRAEFEGVRYRLDHGLTVSSDGDLELFWPREGRPRLTGKIDVERGSLRRNIQLERELMRMFNSTDLATGELAFLKDIDLDINLVTREGVRIKNNLADLRADWDLIRVRGTLANPTIAGSIDVDPGGFVTAYGQTVRIDQGSLIFSGVPGEPPRMDFETTTSAEDPRLRSQWDSVWSTGSADKDPGGGFWDRYDPQSGANAFQADEFATGLTSYFQNRFLQSISGGVPLVELSVQPLPLMGETDTTARWTMSYHLTPQISYVISQNPREAEGRTDIVNLQNFALAPSLRAQVFRNDQANHGVTLQQMLEFGGGRTAEDAMPNLGSIELDGPSGLSKRRVRRATGLRRGQPVAEGADFDIEIDMLDALARKGFPAADVRVEVQSVPRNRVIVGVAVEPGPRVEFAFTGDRPQRRARQDIRALYQPTGMEDSPALETIRRDTVRALRARGFLDPQVEVIPEYEDPGNLSGNRTIRVHSASGRQVNPQNLQFQGVPEDVEQGLVGVFSSRLSRVELATEEVVADQLLQQTMATVGYSEAQILSRVLSEDGSTLMVEVEPGPRRHLAAVRIVGVDPELKEELDSIRALQPGDPVRTGQIAYTSFLMEDHLRDKGFANAAVQTRIEMAASGNEGEFDLYFDVEVGREHRIGEIQTEGLSNSSPAWVKKVSRLEPGDLLTPSEVSEARRRLARTGIFQRIAVRREETSDEEGTSIFTPITFDLEEHARYRVTYGVRAESTREAGVVADISDLNFLGRGQTLGLRLIYATLERNARLYWSIPRIRQTNKNLEFFLEARREEQVPVVTTDGDEDRDDETGVEVENVIAKIQEAWAQITFPAGRRSVHRLYTVYKRSVTKDPTKPEDVETTVLSPYSGWQVSFDTGERSFFETSTEKVTFFLGSDLSFASENLGSDYTGYGWFGQIKPQVPLVKMGKSALVWVHNYRTGLREAQDDEELPFFDRLFAGGEFSVRGYPTNSLGPLSDEGIPLGGEAMFVTNQELRFPIWSLVSGVAFFDAGNVWATREDVDSTLFTSIGAGLRADSPIGPLRLDFAYPLDRREGDPEYKIYFGLGQTF
jgi:outer membrane protein assembly factor BamA